MFKFKLIWKSIAGNVLSVNMLPLSVCCSLPTLYKHQDQHERQLAQHQHENLHAQHQPEHLHEQRQCQRRHHQFALHVSDKHAPVTNRQTNLEQSMKTSISLLTTALDSDSLWGENGSFYTDSMRALRLKVEALTNNLNAAKIPVPSLMPSPN